MKLEGITGGEDEVVQEPLCIVGVPRCEGHCKCFLRRCAGVLPPASPIYTHLLRGLKPAPFAPRQPMKASVSHVRRVGLRSLKSVEVSDNQHAARDQEPNILLPPSLATTHFCPSGL